jgi:hypothetical protein
MIRTRRRRKRNSNHRSLSGRVHLSRHGFVPRRGGREPAGKALSQALTLQYDKVIFVLRPSEPAKAAIGKRVTVVDYPDGRLSIRYNGVELAYRTFGARLSPTDSRRR